MDYIESGMDFSPLFTSEEFQSFYIEKSNLYQNIKNDSVKSVEFIVIKNQEFYFIEAKSSFPANESSKDEQILYDKLHHTLDLFIAQNLGLANHTKSEISEEFGDKSVLGKDISKFKLHFYLIMSEKFEEKWCKNVLTLLRKKLTPLRKIWDIEVKVITEQEARRLNFIQ